MYVKSHLFLLHSKHVMACIGRFSGYLLTFIFITIITVLFTIMLSYKCTIVNILTCYCCYLCVLACVRACVCVICTDWDLVTSCNVKYGSAANFYEALGVIQITWTLQVSKIHILLLFFYYIEVHIMKHLH